MRSITSSVLAAGALVSNADALAVFLDGLISGSLMSELSFQEMTDTSAGAYGSGIGQAVLGSRTELLAHSGSTPGYSSTMAIDPATGDTLVIVADSDQLVADRLVPLLLSDW